MKEYHTPVLLNESVDGLNIQPGGVYVDATFGGGGHAREILRRLGKNGRLYAFDQDAEAYENRIDDERFVFVRGNFRYLKNFLRYHGMAQVDGVLADLGVSSHHFDDSSRGFSFRFDGDLDMRMNRQGGKSAADVLNGYSEGQLANLFFFYGELKSARKMAQAIVSRREKEPIKTVADFLSVMEAFAFRDKEKKILAQAFQSLRIEVNDEMEALRQMLRQALDVLREGGRLSVISYHSIEDRIVKNFFRTGNFEGEAIKDFFGNPI
ncbi:MAG: 16S rRNA (cytosine(1402)-N(4))-methyltransferase RsmH, partial [Dysgonamonadaceae bacterium]|nr:16S rRNA (cytosine(1402)-N(4))-methyltransferase RsmH [Dysgonamonadaceae bacterium]